MKKLLVLTMLLLVSIVLISSYYYFTTSNPSPALLSLTTLTESGLNETKTLKRYWQLTKLSPIMAVPGMDVATIEQDLALLKDSLTAFDEYYDEKELQTIKSTLFPLSYIDALVNLEQKRRTFVDNPSLATAENYHEQLLVTVAHYTLAAEQLASYITAEQSPQLAFINGYTSASHISTTLQKISERAELLQKEEKKRYECLLNEKDCEALSEPFFSVHNNFVDTTKTPIPDHVPIYAELFKKYYLPNKNTERDQPLVVKQDSECYASDKSVVYRTWWPKVRTNPEQSSIRTTVVNDILLQPNKDFDHPYHNALLELGLTYDIQDTAPYFCIDYGLDSATVVTALSIYENLQVSPLLPEGVSNPHLEAAFENERFIRESKDYLHVSAVAEYFKNIELALADVGEPTILLLLGEDNFKRLLEQRLIWRTQTGYFNQHLLLFADLTSHLKKGILPRVKIPINQLLITRSFMSFFFLTGNATVIGSTPTTFLEKKEEVALSNFKIKSYHNEEQEVLPLSDFESYLQTYSSNGRKFSGE